MTNRIVRQNFPSGYIYTSTQPCLEGDYCFLTGSKDGENNYVCSTLDPSMCPDPEPGYQFSGVDWYPTNPPLNRPVSSWEVTCRYEPLQSLSQSGLNQPCVSDLNCPSGYSCAEVVIYF